MSNELRLSNRSSKKKGIKVSWPQNVVKTVEAGAPIKRPIEIQNQAERILSQETGNNAAPESVERVGATVRIANIDIATEHAAVPGEESITAVHTSNAPAVEEATLGTPPQANRVSINTISVQEWMSEPRTPWRRSSPRIEATVSKLRLIKPELRSVGLISPQSNPTEDQGYTADRTLPNKHSLEKNRSTHAPHQKKLVHTLASAPPTGMLDETSSTRPPFVAPQAIAVQKDSWRYSVDAAMSCNRERVQHLYSMHGDGFSDLLQPNEILDLEALEKIKKLRRKTFDLTGNAGANLGGINGSNTDGEAQRKIAPLLTIIRRARGTLETKEHGTISEALEDTSPPSHDDEEMPTRDSPPKDIDVVTITGPSKPTHDFADPPQTPETRPSTVSSNIRTPKAYCGLSQDIVDRVQVKVYPKETKAEYTERGRSAVLDRWIDRERLAQRRKESRGVEKKDQEGVIWRSADILLGKISYAPGPAVLREVPIRAPKHPPAAPQTNGLGEPYLPPMDARPFKLRQPPPPPPQNSPVESDFSDLLSTSGYPRRIPGSAQQIPPPPSCAVVPYSTSTSPDTQPSSRTVTPRKIFSPQSRQPGPWDIPDVIYPLHTDSISAAMAKELLFKYVLRPLHPVHSQNRNRRLAESQLFFTMEPPRNFVFNNLKDMVAYVLEARNAVQREGFVQEFTTLNRVNLLRLIISKEFVPHPLLCKDVFPTLQLFNGAWPVGEALGLRPFGLLHFMHEDAEIMAFLSTEDDALYLWSEAWDERVFGARTLIRAATTIDECERGILNGLHVLGFEQGGWLKIDGYDDQTIDELNAEMAEEEDIYGYEDWTKGLNVQM